MENVENVESESSQLGCQDTADETGELLLPVVVLRAILDNLSNADLLNLSLVNKEWNYEARSVLRDRGSLTAKMNTRDGKCKDLLRAFAADLRRMKELRKVVPLSGLTIAIRAEVDPYRHRCEESSTGELDPVFEDILHHIQWKHFALHWTYGYPSVLKENCAGFMLMKKILDNYSGILEEFFLKFDCHIEALFPNFLQNYNFSHLKILKFQPHCDGAEDFIKVLVSHAPNLKVLCSKGYVDLTNNLLEGRTAAVHLTDYPYELPNEAIPLSILDQLRLRQLKLTSVYQDLNAERFSRMVPKLLENSRTTLSSMHLDARFLAPLMNYGTYLKNVQTLTVTLSDSDVSQPYSSGFLESFDFNRLFPNLSSVKIDSCRDYPDHERKWNSCFGMVEQGNATLTEPDERNVNVKKLTLGWSRISRVSGDRFLVKMFGHIEKVVIQTDGAPLVRVWDHWLDLEELLIILFLEGVHFFGANVVENLDSALCGIFPEEVAELRQRDDEYLQRVHIVPVMPSLSCLKRLKTFRLWFSDPSPSVDPTTKLSRVTGWIAFKRRPDLTVTLATNCGRLKRGLQHMEPYASIRLTRRGVLPDI